MHSTRPGLRLPSLASVTPPPAAGGGAESPSAAAPLETPHVALEEFGIREEVIMEVSASSFAEVLTARSHDIEGPLHPRQFPD
jgi:hypothetical protein